MKRKLIYIARKLRRSQTDAEGNLWKYLRKNQLEGFKFRRQHPIGRYVVDFVNLKKKIIIEADGGHHLESGTDRKRDEILKKQGFITLRFWDSDVLNNIESVLEVIRGKLLSSPHPNPLPQGEREKT